MRPPDGWHEEGALPGAIVLSVDGVNQDELDKLEIENFARGLSAPAKEDPGGKPYARSSRMTAGAMTPTDGVRAVLAFLFAGIAIAISAGGETTSTFTIAMVVAAFLLGLGLPSIVRFILAWHAAPVVGRITRGTFRLSFDAGHFVCTGAGTPEVRIELARVRSFTGGRRLSIELKDAPTATLPLSVASRDNTPLAMRLNDLLSASRATSSRAW